jgi:hypothetical protein
MLTRREDYAWLAQVAQAAHMLTLSRWAVSPDAAIPHSSGIPLPTSASRYAQPIRTITPKEDTALLLAQEDSSQTTRPIELASLNAPQVQCLSMVLGPSAALLLGFAEPAFSAITIHSYAAHVQAICPSATLSPSSAC